MNTIDFTPELQDARKIIGRRLGTADRDIGVIRDLLVDCDTWSVKYVLADTGNWLPGRQVLFAPSAFMTNPFSKTLAPKSVLRVDVTLHKIASAPILPEGRSLTRAYDEELLHHFGWSEREAPSDILERTGPRHASCGLNGAETGPEVRRFIRLSRLFGHSLVTPQGAAGSVSTARIDDLTWRVRQFEIEMGYWYRRKPILLHTSDIVKIDEAVPSLYVSFSKQDLRDTPRNAVISAALMKV